MRRVVAVISIGAVSGCVAWTSPALGETHTPPTSVPADRRGPAQVVGLAGNITHIVEDGSDNNTSLPQGSPINRTGRRVVGPVYYASFPRFVTQPDGSRCVRVVRRVYSDPVSAATAEDTQNILWRISAQDYPLCQRASVPDTTPAAEAASFWRVVGEDLLPTPAPRIAPGYMLAGKLAYLETNSVPTAHFEHETPLGVLTIDATSTLFVDWGDGGGLDGPHAGPGAPWPNGTITHSWTTAKTYDIRVVQRWSATWRLGSGSPGQLVGLTTEGLIDDFEVRQLQAVRNN